MGKRRKNVASSLINASMAAMFAAIEIHNKPLIQHRYATVSMLFINAWELCLKAFIYKYISKSKIYEKNSDGHTISFTKALVLTKDFLCAKGQKNFLSTYNNLLLLDEYRNTNVHYFESNLDSVIFMLLTKNLLDYKDFLHDNFNTDITDIENLIILPLGFNLPFNPVDFLNKNYNEDGNEFVSKIVAAIKNLNNDDISDSIIVGFDTFLASI